MKICIKSLFLFPASFLVLALTLAATLSSSAAITLPTLTITEPKTGAKSSNDVYTVTGTVKAGTFGIANVEVSLNGADYAQAELSKTSWTNKINLVVGTNTITAFVTDTNGNSSPLVTTKLVFIIAPPTLIITAPKNGAKWSNDVYTVTGTVKATTYPISSVQLSVNGSASSTTLSGTNWNSLINLTAGTNIITAYALDTNSDSSLIVTDKLTFIVVPPTLTITTPKTDAKWSNNVYTVTGTIKSHTYALSNIVLLVNGSSVTTSVSGTNWNAQINLNVGTNIISAQALDTNNDSSATATVNLIYIPVSRLTLRINGDGKVSPNLSNDVLVVGTKYSLQAMPDTGFDFYFWNAGGFMTNSATLKFTMVSNLVITANFIDVTPPTLTITSPKNGGIYSNALITASGTASDKYEPLTLVQVQINGGGWLTATGTTNWSIANLPVVHGSNIVQVTALDAAGLYSKTNVLQLFGVPPQGAWAPASLTNTLITLTPLSPFVPTAPHALCLSAKSFTYSETNAFYTNWGIGQYGFIPVDTNYSVVDLSFTAPTTVAYGDVVLDLAFDNYNTGYYTNEASGEFGSFTIQSQAQLAPTNWSGKSYTLTPQGLTTSYTVDFTSASDVTTSGSGQGSTGTYEVDNASPIASFFVVTLNGGTELSQRYAQTTFTSKSGGYYEIEYYEDGVMEKYEIGNFVAK